MDSVEVTVSDVMRRRLLAGISVDYTIATTDASAAATIAAVIKVGRCRCRVQGAGPPQVFALHR